VGKELPIRGMVITDRDYSMSIDTEPSDLTEPANLRASARPDVLAPGTEAALEAALQKEMVERRQERFYWILACVVLMDLAAFPSLGVVAIICVFLIELSGLAVLARKYADERIVAAIDRIVASIRNKVRGM
jgi:hypothetical protein